MVRELQVQRTQVIRSCDRAVQPGRDTRPTVNVFSAGAIGWQLQGSPTAGLHADRRHGRHKVGANNRLIC